MIDARTGRRIAAATLLVLLSMAAPAPHALAAGKKEAGGTSASRSAAPFARVYLALRGCTSCSHCRTAIRQMVQSATKGGQATIASDLVEVRYPTPRPVPLRDVIRSLAQSRLHDLSVVDVLFEATGTLAVGTEGARFVLSETGQSFPIALSRALERPADGKPVRVVALVDGWRGKGALSLVAREVRAGA